MDKRNEYEVYLDEMYGRGRSARTDELALEISKKRTIYDMTIEEAVAHITGYSWN